MTQRHVLIEEDGFELIGQPKAYWASWVSHKDCPRTDQVLPYHAPWKWVNIYEAVCPYCEASVPEGILGAWTLHNYENHLKALHLRRHSGRSY